MIIKKDCTYFRGDVPCKPNKKSGYICETCPEYSKISNRILIIKLGAIGDVIRTTPLLKKIKNTYTNPYITWLTYYPDVVSKNWVNKVLTVNAENIEYLKNCKFDILINLDKDPIAIALAKSVNAEKKVGFIIDDEGYAKPISTKAEEHKYITGLFDNISKLNTKHYVEEVFDIAGFDFNDEEYIVEYNSLIKWDIDKNKKTIGLNTGCGGRWSSRLWKNENWIELAQKLIQNGYEVVLLGGEQEHSKNQMLAEKSGAKYFGFYSLNDFMSLMDECDIIVTAVTMAMHLAIGLRKNLILFNNIFNKNEFYLYNRGEIIEPEFDCNCYFDPVCPNDCMQYIYPEKVYAAIENPKQIPKAKKP